MTICAKRVAAKHHLIYMTTNDQIFMTEAIAEAKLALEIDEVPIGAVAVLGDSVIGRAHNIRETTSDPLGHAEILVLEKIVKARPLPSWRFDEVTIYVTCEPCIMCMGACLQARVKRIVYGCKDPKAGACGSLFDLSCDERLNHQIEITSGVMADECGKLLSNFFERLRCRRSEVRNRK